METFALIISCFILQRSVALLVHFDLNAYVSSLANLYACLNFSSQVSLSSLCQRKRCECSTIYAFVTCILVKAQLL